MATVYRKTAKGQTEIETRVDRLAPRLRTALILVDGKRDSDELAKLFLAEPAATLATLLDRGYIEVVGITAASDLASRKTDLPIDMPEADPQAFARLRRDAVRHITDRLGPMADAIATRIEKATDPGQLLPHLQLARQVLRDHRGAAAAAEFERLFIAAAPA